MFGSYLRPDVERLGDLDVAVELQPKEQSWSRLHELNQRRLQEVWESGRQVRGTFEQVSWWYLETFRFLKGRSRVLSLHDFASDKAVIDATPHRVVVGPDGSQLPPLKRP